MSFSLTSIVKVTIWHRIVITRYLPSSRDEAIPVSAKLQTCELGLPTASLADGEDELMLIAVAIRWAELLAPFRCLVKEHHFQIRAYMLNDLVNPVPSTEDRLYLAEQEISLYRW